MQCSAHVLHVTTCPIVFVWSVHTCISISPHAGLTTIKHRVGEGGRNLVMKCREVGTMKCKEDA